MLTELNFLPAVGTYQSLPVAFKQGCEGDIKCFGYLDALLYGWLEFARHKLGDIRLGNAKQLCQLGGVHTFGIQYFLQSHSAKISSFFGKTKELLMESLRNIRYYIIFVEKSISNNLNKEVNMSKFTKRRKEAREKRRIRFEQTMDGLNSIIDYLKSLRGDSRK